MIKRLRQYWKNRTSRRRFLLGTAGGGMAAMGAGYAYMRLWESGWLEVNRREVKLDEPHRPETPLKILHLSDLHASKVVSLAFLRRAMKLGLDLRPDLICVTGDFITWKYNRYEEYAKVLGELSAAAPTFACLGNHDGGTWAEGKMKLGNGDSREVRELLEAANITLLHNEHTTAMFHGREINLVGVGDLWNRECEPDKAFAGIDTRRPTVLLSHNPDTKDELLAHPWQLMLSGHTHGGQLYLPGLGAPLAPVKNKKFVRGLHQLSSRGDRWLYISKGVGNLHGVRLNCRPEVALLTLA